MRFGHCAVGALSGIVLAATAAAGVTELISNGSFETPVITGTFQQFSSSIPGWTGSAGIEIQANGALGAGQGTSFGNQYAELAVEGPSTYTQTVDTTAGRHYLLAFYLAARPGTGANTVNVGFTGNAADEFTVQDAGTVKFQPFTEDFVATSARSVLSFQPVNLEFPGGGDLIDNVSLSTSNTAAAVPLPSAVWMGLTGLLGITTFGVCRRLRRPRASP